MSAAAIELRRVTKRYGRTVALDQLDLVVPRGTVCGLVGPNGAGKTTCFGVVGGLVVPDGGAVSVLGLGPFRARTHGGRVGLLPQDSELPPHTPVASLLGYLARLGGLGPRAAEREVARVLDLVALTDRARSRIRSLSHGMRRRVAVAQALVGSPELVLLDEPTSGLDPHLVVHMREVLRRQASASTLVVSSHVLGDLEAICDHVVFLERGRVLRAGPLAEVTGAGHVVRVECEGEAPLEALGARLPELVLRQEGRELVITAPAPLDVPSVIAMALPALLAAGVRVLGVRRGDSLEDAYMALRRRRAPPGEPGRAA